MQTSADIALNKAEVALKQAFDELVTVVKENLSDYNPEYQEKVLEVFTTVTRIMNLLNRRS